MCVTIPVLIAEHLGHQSILELENLGGLGKNENAKKSEKLPSSLAKKIHLTPHILAQAQSSLASNGVTSVPIDQKCKIFPGQPLGCTCAHTHVCMIYFLNHRGRMHRLLIWIEYSYFFLFPLQVCIRKCYML